MLSGPLQLNLDGILYACGCSAPKANSKLHTLLATKSGLRKHAATACSTARSGASPSLHEGSDLQATQSSQVTCLLVVNLNNGTLSALMMTTKSPVSAFGVYCGLFLYERIMAAFGSPDDRALRPPASMSTRALDFASLELSRLLLDSSTNYELITPGRVIDAFLSEITGLCGKTSKMLSLFSCCAGIFV